MPSVLPLFKRWLIMDALDFLRFGRRRSIQGLSCLQHQPGAKHLRLRQQQPKDTRSEKMLSLRLEPTPRILSKPDAVRGRGRGEAGHAAGNQSKAGGKWFSQPLCSPPSLREDCSHLCRSRGTCPGRPQHRLSHPEFEQE